MGESSLVMGMQRAIAAINGGFPEGVWLNALFRFLFNRRYLTAVFQGDDVCLLNEGVHEWGPSSVIATSARCPVGKDVHSGKHIARALV